MPGFKERLHHLMKRWEFPPTFIAAELQMMDGITVGKTNSRRILGIINHLQEAMPYYLERVRNLPFEELPLKEWENYFTGWCPHQPVHVI